MQLLSLVGGFREKQHIQSVNEMKWSISRLRISGVLVVLGCMTGFAVSAQESTVLPDIKDFVQQTYIHGVPYEIAYRYDRRVVPALLEMLEDKDQSEYWPNIVVTLGMIGDESAVDPLTNFLLQGRGKASQAEYAARSSVLLALGYLANKSGSEAALAYLQESVDPSVWSTRKLRWASPYQDEIGRDEQLSMTAILGLALSGQDAARKTLMDLQNLSPARAADPFARSAAELASSALEEHKHISEKGMLSYARRHRGPEPEPIGLITGAEAPPEVVTGRRKAPSVPRPAMDTPTAPPKPELSEAPRVPEAELIEPPDPDDGDR